MHIPIAGNITQLVCMAMDAGERVHERVFVTWT